MKKSDLEIGMIVETAQGNRYLVLEKCIVRSYGYISLSSYNEDLECENTDCNIIKVFKLNYRLVCNIKSLFEDRSLILLWERKLEPIELTLEDIAEKFNVDVNLIKIKK